MKQYVVDAFTDKLFAGNQAAVCILEHWLIDELMLNIAKENNFSETAFCVKDGDLYHLRWFTPNGEIDFCGHATLGTAFVIKNFVDRSAETIHFKTMKGDFYVKENNGIFQMNFPAYKLNKIEVTEQMTKAIGVRPIEAYMDRDLLLVLDNEDYIRTMKPNIDVINELDSLCVAVTAKGKDFDCVSRVFVPKLNVPEDPVTGSIHCMIIPYWANKLNKKQISAFQASERTGVLKGHLEGDRVILFGSAVLYSIAELAIND